MYNPICTDGKSSRQGQAVCDGESGNGWGQSSEGEIFALRASNLRDKARAIVATIEQFDTLTRPWCVTGLRRLADRTGCIGLDV